MTGLAFVANLLEKLAIEHTGGGMFCRTCRAICRTGEELHHSDGCAYVEAMVTCRVIDPEARMNPLKPLPPERGSMVGP